MQSREDANLQAAYTLARQEEPEALNKWEGLKAAISNLQNLSRTAKTREARRISSDLIQSQNIVVISKIFKYAPILEEYQKLSAQLVQYINSSSSHLQDLAREHFSQVFGERFVKIEFFSKGSGEQLGNKAIITYKNHQEELVRKMGFFIKTHQHGSNVSGSSHGPLDLKEIFIYKFLEFAGIGPEVQFFYSKLSRGAFYIATRDAGYVEEREKLQAEFLTYQKLKERLASNPKGADQVIIDGLVALDLISRMFMLRDVTTNPDNFGFLMMSGKTSAVKLIDFRIETHDNYRYHDISGGWKSGNGLFVYDYDPMLKYHLKDKPVQERAGIANKAIEWLSSSKTLSALIDETYGWVNDYVQQNKRFMGASTNEMDLKNYIENVKMNCLELQQGIKKFLLPIDSSLASLGASSSVLSYESINSSISSASSAHVPSNQGQSISSVVAVASIASPISSRTTIPTLSELPVSSSSSSISTISSPSFNSSITSRSFSSSPMSQFAAAFPGFSQSCSACSSSTNSNFSSQAIPIGSLTAELLLQYRSQHSAAASTSENVSIPILSSSALSSSSSSSSLTSAPVLTASSQKLTS